MSTLYTYGIFAVCNELVTELCFTFVFCYPKTTGQIKERLRCY